MPNVRWLFAALILTIGLAPQTAKAQELGDDERKQLESGEVLVEARTLEGGGGVLARARALVDGDPGAIWKHVAACESYSEFMPRTAESRLVEKSGERVVCYVRIDMPFPVGDLWSETEAIHRELSGNRFERRWKLLRGSYTRNEGYWRLVPWEGDETRTLVTYQLLVRPEKSVPQALLREAQRRSLPDMIGALRKRAAAH